MSKITLSPEMEAVQAFYNGLPDKIIRGFAPKTQAGCRFEITYDFIPGCTSGWIVLKRSPNRGKDAETKVSMPLAIAAEVRDFLVEHLGPPDPEDLTPTPGSVQ